MGGRHSRRSSPVARGSRGARALPLAALALPFPAGRGAPVTAVGHCCGIRQCRDPSPLVSRAPPRMDSRRAEPRGEERRQHRGWAAGSRRRPGFKNIRPVPIRNSSVLPGLPSEHGCTIRKAILPSTFRPDKKLQHSSLAENSSQAL
ncbi:hypothetical protein Nmel_001441 [Mimus melanotis]